MRRSVLYVLVGFAVVALMACGAPAPAPASPQQPSAPAAAPAKEQAPAKEAPAAAPKPAQAPAKPAATGAAKVVKLAGVNALTDQSAAYGTRSHNGARLAVKLVNEAGGFADTCGNRYTLELTTSDMANDRNQAISLVRRAAEDKDVLAVVGPTPSTGFVAVVPVAEQVKMPLMGIGSAAPIKQWSRWAYRLALTSDFAEPAMLTKLHEKFRLTKVAFIYDQTQDAQTASARLLRDKAKEIGAEVVAFEAFRAGDQDFTTQLTTIKASGAAWVGIYGAPPESGKIARQLVDLGIKASLFTGFGTFMDTVAWDISNGAVQGGYTWAALDLRSKDAKLQDYIKAYKASYTDEPTYFSVYGNDAVMVLVDAVKRSCTNTDREKFATALGSSAGVQGVGGKMTFKNPPTGENLTPTVIVTKTTARGEFEVVE